MPFKLKLKKSRQYSVVNKSLFVISVEILDGTNIECTLSSESLAQDCLDVVCQKLNLNQPKFFGLLYPSRTGSLRWLELDKPIKRQLDKHSRGLNIYLRVMYYVVSGVRLLDDEVTRYHYFLQLKMDIMEGRISCDPQQAVELAGYCMQAEFGNFDAERHTAHYLKDFQLFPKTFTDVNLLDTLTEAASRQHAALYNLAQGTAEEYYICACQRLEGYGQEMYPVKDKSGEDVMLGVSLTGITVSYASSQENRTYGWSDISNVINNKKEFAIESVIGSEKSEFQFPDAESSKNAWYFCVLQHMFYRQYEMVDASDQSEKNLLVMNQQRIEESARPIDSYEDVTNIPTQWSNRAQSTSCLDLNKPTDIDKLRSLLPSYRPAPDYETAMQQQQKYRNSSGAPVPRTNNQRRLMMYSSQPEIHQNGRFPDVTHNNVESGLNLYNKGGNQHVDLLGEKLGLLHIYKPPPPYPSNRISSNSTPDLAGISQQNHFVNLVSGSSPDLVSSGIPFVKPFYNPQVHRSNSYLPQGTYENLAGVFNNNRPQALIVDNSKHYKKILDEHGNFMYCLPANIKQILEDHNTRFSSTEPIYENIPLSWRNDDDEMRTRTQSIHSAPDVSQVINHSTVNQLLKQHNALSKENLYANVNSHNNSTDAVGIINRNESPQRPANVYQKSPHNSNQTLNSSATTDASKCSSSSKTMSRANTYVVNKNVSCAAAEDGAGSGNGASHKSRKRLWGMLMGRSKSSEKVKSATLGREKDRSKERHQANNKHRWSTGLPRFQPLPPSISKETMCQLLENKLADSQLFFEFDKIPKRQQNSEFTTAQLPENAVFNRFKDVLPYEENRVRLTPTRENKYGYINSSHITATVGSKQRFYIAAQGPYRTTLPYFWQCVWESEVYLIVQLTDATENFSYLPDANDRCIDVGQDYQIWWEFSQKTGHCVTSKVRLCHVSSRRYRTLWHLHYTDWGDQGCPHSVAHFLGFLEEMQSVRQHSMAEIPPGHNKNPPMLVHCTAGVGRTGLAILADLLLYTVDHNQEVDIPRVVGLLRQQRAYMVQTIAQYRFVYSLLIHYLKQTRLI